MVGRRKLKRKVPRAAILAMAALARVLTVCGAQSAPAPTPAMGPHGPVGPDVAWSDAEQKRFAQHVTVEGCTAAAVQAACDRAAKEGVRVMFLPAGEYAFNAEVKVPSGLTLLGEGSKTLIRTEGKNTKLFSVDGDRVRFTRLKLQGADTTRSEANDTYGISAYGKQHVRIDHCELLGFSYATTFGSEATAQVDHCHIHHNLREGLGYGVAIYSGAYVLITDNDFSQNRHSLASNGTLDWSSPQRVGKYLHKPGRKTHWEFIHNRVGSNDLSTYELMAVDTHPGMDGSFIVAGNIFENLRHSVGIRDGSGLIEANLFRNLRTTTTFRPLVAVSIAYGTHNNIPVDGCMPHDIAVRENVVLMPTGAKFEKCSLGKAENITLEGRLVPKTKVDRPAPPAMIRLMEMDEDGTLKWREEQPAAPEAGSVVGVVADETGKLVAGASVLMGERSATTDAEGRFAFDQVTEAAGFAVVSKPGFELALPGLSVRAGQRVTVNVRLAADRTPPAFVGVGVADITHTSATIAWATDELTTAQLEWNQEVKQPGDWKSQASGNVPATSHRAQLTDLRPTATYRVRIKSTDAAGNAATSDELRFSTAPVPDPALPAGWGYYLGGGKGLWGRTAHEAHSGKFSAFLKAVAHEHGSLNIALVAGESDGYSGVKAYPAQPGATYGYSFWAKGDLQGVRLVLLTWNSDAADAKARQQTRLATVAPVAEWTEAQGEFTMPAEAKRFVLTFQVYAENLKDQNLGVLYVDDVEVTTGATQALRNGGSENEQVP